MDAAITTAELTELLSAGPLALFDVRGDVEYEREHIPGSMTAPLGSLVFRVASVMNSGSRVVVYSRGEGCSLASEARTRLLGLGLTNVKAYEEGLEGWRAAGNPLVESRSPKLITRGPFENVRPLVVDRERAYGGAFRGDPTDDVEGAGG